MQAIKATKIATLQGHKGALYALSKTASPHLILSGGSDKSLVQWNLQSKEGWQIASQFPAIIYAICFIEEQNMVFVGTSTGGIHVIDLEKKREIKMLQHHTGGVFDIRYSWKNKLLYATSGDGSFSICSLESLSLIKIKKLCKEKVRSLDISENEIALACGDGSIRIVDLANLEEKVNFKAHELSANSVKYHPNGNYLLSGGRDAHLNIWDISSNYKQLTTIPAHNFAIYDIQFSPTTNLFATASRDKTIKIWDANLFELILRINKEKHEGHSYSVNKLCWSNYNDYLLSTGDDRNIMIWDIAIG